jgi:hypothetical protein
MGLFYPCTIEEALKWSNGAVESELLKDRSSTDSESSPPEGREHSSLTEMQAGKRSVGWAA